MLASLCVLTPHIPEGTNIMEEHSSRRVRLGGEKCSFRRTYVIKPHPVPNHWIVIVKLHGVRTQNATIWTIPAVNIWKFVFVLCYFILCCIGLYVTWKHRPNHSASRVAAARSMDRCGAAAVIMAFLVLQQMSRMKATAVFQYGINFSNYDSFRRSVGFLGWGMGWWQGLIMLYVPECLRFLRN